MSQKKRSTFWLTIAGVLTFIGIILIVFTVQSMLYNVSEPAWEHDETELREQYHDKYHGRTGGGRDDRLQMSIIMLVGSSLTAAGLFILVKRYSLRSLLAFVLIAGALGVVPLQLPKPVPARSHVKLRFSNNLPSEQITLIRERLQPAAALPTLPAGLLKKLQLPPGGGIGKVDVTACENGVEMVVVACAGLEGERRDTIMEFYIYYFKLLVFETALAEGLRVGSPPNEVSFTGEWKKWRAKWNHARLKEEGTVTPSPWGQTPRCPSLRMACPSPRAGLPPRYLAYLALSLRP